MYLNAVDQKKKEMEAKFLAAKGIDGADAQAALEAEKKAKRAVARFKSEYRTKSLRKRCNALLILSTVQHEITVAEFRKVVKKAKRTEILEASYMVLGDMPKVVDAAAQGDLEIEYVDLDR